MTTNREKLAKMTNEELAKFFANISKRCPNCRYYDALPITHFNKHCYIETLKWLEQESEK